MHQLGYVNIKNYRVCRDVSLSLEGFTPLVGQNNSGKSTILDAIKWVLKPTTLSTSDFFDIQKPIEIYARIDGVTQVVIDTLPDQKHRTAIEPFCKSGSIWIRVVATGTTAKAIKQEIFNYEEYSAYVSTNSEVKIPDQWRDYPTGLPQAVSALLPESLHIEAMEDIGEDLGKAKAGSTIKALLDEIMQPILKAHGDLNNAIATVRNILTSGGEHRSIHLKEFDQKATNALESFFPDLALDLDLQVIDVKEFFKAGDLHVTDKVTGDRRRFDQMGTGAQRAIQMSLIRYLADTTTSNTEKPTRRLLLIDEPELYLHPQGVRRLRQALLELSKAGFQVIFSTHSPLMLSRENAVDTVIVLKNKEAGTLTHKPLRQVVKSALNDAESQSRTLFELGNLAEIYFSDLVVLCEGKTDKRLLPLAYERIYGRSPELDHITFVSLGACSDIPKALKVLGAMGIKSCAVADLDFAFVEARKGSIPLLPKEGQDLIRIKQTLETLKKTHEFPLQNSLPTNCNKTGWKAAETWALVAQQDVGKEIILETHESLKGLGVWVWTVGCIEQITKHTEKGEDAIIQQESHLSSISSEDIQQEMPEFKLCFDWLRKKLPQLLN